MHPTRRAILESLRTLGQATVNDLADRVGVKAITVRHHLNRLLADGLVSVEEKRQPVGRPLYLYTLSEAGERLPVFYYSSSVEHLLQQIQETLSPAAAERMIANLTSTMAAEIQREFASLPRAQRMRRLVEVLSGVGFNAEWERSESELRLVEYHCPYVDAGQQHPELCQIDETLIRAALQTDIEKRSCLLAGDATCTYVLLKS